MGAISLRSRRDLGDEIDPRSHRDRDEITSVTLGLYRHLDRLKHGSHAPGFVTVRRNGAEW